MTYKSGAIGEWRSCYRLIAKAILPIIRDDIQASAGPLQLYCVLDSYLDVRLLYIL